MLADRVDAERPDGRARAAELRRRACQLDHSCANE
jgi:hypothetical protein